LVAGRDLQWTDGPAAVVTATLARKLYPNGNAIGRRIRPNRASRDLEIVGVIGNLAFNGPRLGWRDVAFIPCLEQMNPWRSNAVVNIFVRSHRNLEDVGLDVGRVLDGHGAQYIYVMEEQEQYLAWSIERERILATVSGAFGVLILALTGVALYAFCSYMLSFRNRELAIRASLGAEPHNLAASLLRETLMVLALGSTVGLASALVLTRVLSGFVVNVGPVSLSRSVQAAVILSLVALVASAIPTVRALRIDLARALRVD
jgi:putative ABC transport system permease protein